MTANAIKMGILALIISYPAIADAQFNTIKKKEFVGYEIQKPTPPATIDTDTQQVDSTSTPTLRIDSLAADTQAINPIFYKKEAVRKKHLGFGNTSTVKPAVVERDLPALTIPNLIAEIRKNGIRHEKIVLAQAILETGWFTSSVCRNKNNLFGLTNPRTGQYYEFNHWTESVRAYYTKVQYRYKEGNYLLWLDRIGYAEDPRYVSSLIKILRQYML